MHGEITNAHDLLEERVNQRTQELFSAFEFSQEIPARVQLTESAVSSEESANAQGWPLNQAEAK
jgi:hypothetical protein